MGLPLEDKRIEKIPSSAIVATLDDFYDEKTKKVKIGMYFILQSFIDDHYRWSELNSIDTLQKILPWINQGRCLIKPVEKNERKNIVVKENKKSKTDDIVDKIIFDFEDL